MQALAGSPPRLAALDWWIGWGTATGAIASDNNLIAPSPEPPATAVAAQAMTSGANDTLTLSATIIARGAVAVTELGAFNAKTGGNLDLYSDFAAINLNAGDSLASTLNLKFG